MKLHVILAACALAIGCGACSSETVSHDASQLPLKAREIISQNFTSAVSVVETEKRMGSIKEYEVVLTDGTEIQFNSGGEWESIDTPNNRPIPTGLIPTSIARFVAEKHNGAYIVGLEKNKKGYEVELSNEVDIQFDAGGNFLKYDK